MTALPPAGWYPDALDATATRWWDGSAWTVHVRRPDAAASVPVAPATPSEPALSRRQLREQVGPLTHGEPEEAATAVAVLERPAEISSVEYARRAGGYEPRAAEPVPYTLDPSIVVYGSVHTLPAWFLATSPLWYLGLTAIVGGVFGVLSQGTQPTWIGFPVLGTFIGILVLLAREDVKRLHLRGYLPPSPAWAVLPIVYLIMRIVRTGARSAGMLVTYVLAQIIYFLLIIVAVIALLAPLLGGSSYETATVQPGQTAPDYTPATLTPDDRAYFLTQEGIESAVAGQLEGSLVVDELHCSTFDQPTPDTTATCIVLAEGRRWVVTLELAPETDNFPFQIIDVSELVDPTVDS